MNMLATMILVAIAVMAVFGIALLLMMVSVSRCLVDAIKSISSANEKVVNKPMDKVMFIEPNKKPYFKKNNKMRKGKHYSEQKNGKNW